MKCNEFRRKLLEDPRRDEADFLAHRASCEACDREAKEVEGMEAELETLLRVDPPADLADRLRMPRRRAWVPVALAASFAGLLGLGVWWWQLSAPTGTAAIVVEVMEHIEHEPEAFASRAALSPDAYRDLSPAVRVETDGWAQAVSYAAPCDILGRPGLHLVLQRAGGPVTVLVITGAQVPLQQLINAAGVRGVVRPLARGTLAVIGGEATAVEAIAAEIAARVRVLA